MHPRALFIVQLTLGKWDDPQWRAMHSCLKRWSGIHPRALFIVQLTLGKWDDPQWRAMHSCLKRWSGIHPRALFIVQLTLGKWDDRRKNNLNNKILNTLKKPNYIKKIHVNKLEQITGCFSFIWC
jgi:hypothetical protein